MMILVTVFLFSTKRIRFRSTNSPNVGFIFERPNENVSLSINGNTGNVCSRSNYGGEFD
jgi:hypothetical protein